MSPDPSTGVVDLLDFPACSLVATKKMLLFFSWANVFCPVSCSKLPERFCATCFWDCWADQSRFPRRTPSPVLRFLLRGCAEALMEDKVTLLQAIDAKDDEIRALRTALRALGLNFR